MPDAVLLKLGGSLLTDKRRPGTVRVEVATRLASEVALAARGPARLVLGHGSGSFGHVAAAEHGLGDGVLRPEQLPGVSETQGRAAELHRMVVDLLRRGGALPFSIAPSSAVVFAGGEPAAFFGEPLRLALGAGLLPVLFGDVVTDSELGIAICSTEQVLALASREMPGWGYSVRRAVWLGETAGLLDEHGKSVPRVSPAEAGELLGAVGEAAGTDVTGGMRLRLATVFALARLGIPSVLADGRVPGLLERAVAGEAVPGTLVSPA
jgi:isopentenyl phosphate kinase